MVGKSADTPLTGRGDLGGIHADRPQLFNGYSPHERRVSHKFLQPKMGNLSHKDAYASDSYHALLGMTSTTVVNWQEGAELWCGQRCVPGYEAWLCGAYERGRRQPLAITEERKKGDRGETTTSRVFINAKANSDRVWRWR